MRHLFVRVGSKYRIREYIAERIPQLETIDTYVEPFAGSASIFFHIDVSGKRIVLNDIDEELINSYELIRKVNVDKLPILHTKSKMYELIAKENKSDEETLMAYMYGTCNSFMSISRKYLWHENSLITKAKQIPKVRHVLKDVILSCEDAVECINKYDSDKAFFFIDPPYESSSRMYKSNSYDYNKLAETLKQLKGKFLLTLNDSANIREIFREFDINQFVVRGIPSGLNRIGSKDRTELLISNLTI